MDSQTSVERLPSPRVRRAHRRARSHASRLPGRFAARSRSPKRLTQDPQPTHKTMRPPAGRGFGGGGRGFGGRSPGGRGFGGRGGRGGRGGFDEGPPDTVVGAFSYASRSLHASRSAGGRVSATPRSFRPSKLLVYPSRERRCWREICRRPFPAFPPLTTAPPTDPPNARRGGHVHARLRGRGRVQAHERQGAPDRRAPRPPPTRSLFSGKEPNVGGFPSVENKCVRGAIFF
jgi:hypothetical protein